MYVCLMNEYPCKRNQLPVNIKNIVHVLYTTNDNIEKRRKIYEKKLNHAVSHSEALLSDSKSNKKKTRTWLQQKKPQFSLLFFVNWEHSTLNYLKKKPFK